MFVKILTMHGTIQRCFSTHGKSIGRSIDRSVHDLSGVPLQAPKEAAVGKRLVTVSVLCLVFSLSAASLSARGSGRDGGVDTRGVTITVLMGIDAAGQHMGDRAEEFEQETGIRVNMIETEWDVMIDRQAEALREGDPAYDIVGCASFMLAEYVPGGMYDDISDLFPPEHAATFMDGIIDAVTVDGKVYAAPLMTSWVIMFYNMQMFDEAGLDPKRPPATWDELVEFGKKLQSPGCYAITDSWGPGEYATVAFFRWAKSAGAEIHEWRDGRVFWMLNDPECINAAQFMKDMVSEGIMDPGSPSYYQQQIADLFGKGHAAMFINWDMMKRNFKDPGQSPYAGKIKAAVIPGAEPGLTASIEGHEYMAIPTASRHREAARKFIQYVTSVENVRRRALEQGMTPVYKELFEDPEIGNVIDLDVIFQAADNCYYRPAVPEYTEVSDVISEEVQKILMEGKDIIQALTDANNRANALSGWQ
jgi:multiple sugar transport system substrate-binding protein